MATLVLQNAGAALGGALFGPLGAVLGRAAGGLAGYAIDQQLFGRDRIVSGPRLEASRIMASADGAPMPKVYGRARIGGQVIWATRFEEVTSRSRQGGGKGSPGVTVTEYTYFANFAVGICEGPIAAIGRVWADGNEIDVTAHEIRLYTGSEDQLPDPLIEAKQGSGNAPAYAGTAYAVFEGFALEAFGNRIPQLSFEVLRPVSRLDNQLKAVTIIPGSTEFGYAPDTVKNSRGIAVNRNNLTHITDWWASIDELVACCPNLETVALVVAWFGTDLRAGQCIVEPRVVSNDTSQPGWSVAGLSRSTASPVSQYEGKAAYGGTPSDASVVAAIGDLKSRGLKVVLYPFVMMDIAEDNELPSPYGGSSQPAYPWRGQITCEIAPGLEGTQDQTAAAATQIADFCGTAASGDFGISGSAVTYSGPTGWRYRRMILHYAMLAQAAGGVDGFLIGSELRGLTQLRDDTDAFPFVDQLCTIAADVRSIAGPETKITYGADWSEYFGYQPGDGSGDRYFHLDPLWAHEDIDAVGIDNYMPLADWRIGGDPGATGFHSQFDPAYLDAKIEGGEGFDWYYADAQDRLDGVRTPITDDLDEPWIWRFKDIRSWWENAHHERVDGVRDTEPTAWVPRSKPVWFTELGCGAITMGANEPNVFLDEKSGQSKLPRFSTGARCDLAQNRFLTTHLDHWTDAESNPVSPVYGAPMIDTSSIFLWSWDARPFPVFPSNRELWADGGNWHTGHWLNGRVGGCPVQDLVGAIAADFGLSLDVQCDGFIDGYVVPGPVTPRQALEPLASLFNITYREEAGSRAMLAKPYLQSGTIDAGEIIDDEAAPLIAETSGHDSDLAVEMSVSHAGVFNDHESVQTVSRRLEALGSRQAQFDLPAVMAKSAAGGAAEARLRDLWIGRRHLHLGLPHRYAALAAGDAISFSGDNISAKLVGEWRISRIEDAAFRSLSLEAIERFYELPTRALEAGQARRIEANYGPPVFLTMDLPVNQDAATPRLHCALDAEPWTGAYAIWSSPDVSGFRLRKTTALRSVTGTLQATLSPGVEGRYDHANSVHVSIRHSELASLPSAQLLNGENAAAIRCANGEWEILQFASAELQGDGSYLLSGLLRAQLGSDAAMLSGAEEGADLVFLDAGIDVIDLDSGEATLTLNWRAGPATDPVSSERMTGVAHAHANLAKRPYSPVHLMASRLGGDDIAIGWTRRSRIDGDIWDAEEIPLGETAERYRVSILRPDETVAREIEVTTPAASYAAADQLTDFGLLPSALTFTVAQLTATGIAGSPRRASVEF